MWPFKQLLLRNGAKSAGKYALPCRVLTHFGAIDRVRTGLHLTNLLTGWGAGPAFSMHPARPSLARQCRGPAPLLHRCTLSCTRASVSWPLQLASCWGPTPPQPTPST